MKSVTRMDYKYTHGWYVRVYNPKNREMLLKFIADGISGKREGRKLAIIWRKSLEKSIGKPRSERPIIMNYTRNTSGYIGIHRGKDKNGNQYFEISATPKKGILKRTKVSITKHGRNKALKRAIEIRKEWHKLYLES